MVAILAEQAFGVQFTVGHTNVQTLSPYSNLFSCGGGACRVMERGIEAQWNGA